VTQASLKRDSRPQSNRGREYSSTKDIVDAISAPGVAAHFHLSVSRSLAKPSKRQIRSKLVLSHNSEQDTTILLPERSFNRQTRDKPRPSSLLRNEAVDDRLIYEFSCTLVP